MVIFTSIKKTALNPPFGSSAVRGCESSPSDKTRPSGGAGAANFYLPAVAAAWPSVYHLKNNVTEPTKFVKDFFFRTRF